MNSLEIHQQQLADQRRGRYVRVSDTDRRQLIDTYKKGEDFIALAKKLNIKRSTARSILRTYIDEGRISAKQRAGTRLRFITEEEAEIIRDMKRRHPLITIGQIQMRLQKTSNRVLSKASISRILTNSIRLGKRAKCSQDRGSDDPMNEGYSQGHEDFIPASSDEGTGGGGGFYLDEEDDDDDDDDDEKDPNGHNLEDFRQFLVEKSGMNDDESIGREQYENNLCDKAYPIRYPNLTSDDDDDDELSEMEGNESKSPAEDQTETGPNYVHATNDTSPEHAPQTSVKSEPVCLFLKQNYDSSDGEQQPSPVDDKVTKTPLNLSSNAAHRRVKVCPICGEKDFSRLSHHLTLVHHMSREESLTLLAHAERPVNGSMMATVSSSSPKTNSSHRFDQSPQPTPININTNNQQIKPMGSPTEPMVDPDNNNNNLPPSIHPSSNEPFLNNYPSIDGKKRLLCPRCDTWVLNLTDHLIKKHHLLSKQERLPFLRLARNRQTVATTEKSSVAPFLITPDRSTPTPDHSKQHSTYSNDHQHYQNIIKKYRKKIHDQTQPSSSSHNSPPADLSSTPASTPTPATTNNPSLMAINALQSLLNPSSPSRLFPLPKLNGNAALMNKDMQQMAVHQKFEQKLSVFRQQFAVTVALQNSLMQQMELLQRSFLSIEEEWNDMKKEIVASIS